MLTLNHCCKRGVEVGLGIGAMQFSLSEWERSASDKRLSDSRRRCLALERIWPPEKKLRGLPREGTGRGFGRPESCLCQKEATVADPLQATLHRGRAQKQPCALEADGSIPPTFPDHRSRAEKWGARRSPGSEGGCLPAGRSKHGAGRG